jgi:hypothetical protein
VINFEARYKFHIAVVFFRIQKRFIFCDSLRHDYNPFSFRSSEKPSMGYIGHHGYHLNKEQPSMPAKEEPTNVIGEPLEVCGKDPVTDFFRDGCWFKGMLPLVLNICQCRFTLALISYSSQNRRKLPSYQGLVTPLTAELQLLSRDMKLPVGQASMRLQ